MYPQLYTPYGVGLDPELALYVTAYAYQRSSHCLRIRPLLRGVALDGENLGRFFDNAEEPCGSFDREFTRAHCEHTETQITGNRVEFNVLQQHVYPTYAILSEEN